jgi:hypothetical protein
MPCIWDPKTQDVVGPGSWGITSWNTQRRWSQGALPMGHDVLCLPKAADFMGRDNGVDMQGIPDDTGYRGHCS